MSVVTGKMPPPDQTAEYRKVLQRLHPDDDGYAVYLPEHAVKVHEALQETNRRLDELKGMKEYCQNALCEMLGEHSAGILPDGTCYTWLTTNRKAYTKEVKANKYHTLRYAKKVPPKLEIRSEFTNTEPQIIEGEVVPEAIEDARETADGNEN